jgi:2-furoyl-CoA dehydrogenase large subunit
MSASTDTSRWIGRPLARREDRRFITGSAEYVDDRSLPSALHAYPVRSIYAHAKILSIDVAEALAQPGVVAVLTAADLANEIKPVKAGLPAPNSDIDSFPLAREKVRYCGEPVVVVLAESPALAEDAGQFVYIDYEPLPPVLDPEAAIESSSALVHERVGTNLAWRKLFSYGNVAAVFDQADHIIRRRLHLHRFTSAPLETRQAAVSFNSRTGQFNIFSNLQNPERYRARIAQSLGLPLTDFHFECPDIGGGFGLKLHLLWVIFLCIAARRTGRPVKWVEDRTGHLSASHHGNEVLYDAELAVKTDGTILGLRTRAIHDEGAYLEREPKGTVNQLRHATLTYRFRELEMDFLAVMTNKCPTGPNRAYGKVQQVFLVERLIDEAARELGMDPFEMRRRNLVSPDQMPYKTPTGAIYDGGDYPRMFQMLCDRVDIEEFRGRQRKAREQGRYLGLGIAIGLEASPSNNGIQRLIDPGDRRSGDSEAARVTIGLGGHIQVATGSVAQGHGHETAISQIVADHLGVLPDQVRVTIGYDSQRDPSTPYSGTHASRFAVMVGGALVGACKQMREKIVQIGAHLLQVDETSLSLEAGILRAQDGRTLTLAELAHVAHLDLASLPAGATPGLEARYVYHPLSLGHPTDGTSGNFSVTYAYGAAAIEVCVDIETGRVKLERIVCLHDCGVQINPLIVEGQIHGAIAHQVGAALFERIEYDEHGQLTTSTFKNYLTPTAADLPRYECGHLETPSLFSPLGARGAGEGAGAPLVATINAVADALAPLGVVIQEGHVSPCDVWTLVKQASRAGLNINSSDLCKS